MKIRLIALASAAALWLLGAGAHESGAASAPAGWEKEWNKVVEAAKKEGEVRIFGPAGSKLRDALTEMFTKTYGISVDYIGAGGFQIPARVERERQTGVYHWDIFMAGTTTLFKGLKPHGALDPIEPALLLPDVKDGKNWRGGEIPFFERDRIGVSVLRGAGQYLFINTKFVRPEEFKSWRDLLNPKWKGKIVMGRDPRIAGYGNATFKFFFTDKNLGQSYIRELLKQEPPLLRDDRVAAQWLAQGKYPICVCSDIDTARLIDEGLPITAIDGRQLREGTHVTSAYANISLANRAPHPNAAKLYANWLLTKEGMTLFSRASGMPAMRLDVPTDHVRPWTIPEANWPVSNTEEGLAFEEPLGAFLKQILGE
jgi:iron(III) transport system substrate-binding protein